MRTILVRCLTSLLRGDRNTREVLKVNALEIIRENYSRDQSPEWEEIRNQIVSDPEVMDGLPVFRGTRIPVYVVLDYLVGGATTDEILKDYPSLSTTKIQTALKFANLLTAIH